MIFKTGGEGGGGGSKEKTECLRDEDNECLANQE